MSDAAKEMQEADFGDKLASAIAAGIAATQGPRKMTIGQYQRAHARKVKLLRETTQNTHTLFLENLTDEQVNLLNRIHRSGRYLKGKVQVVVKNEAQPINEQSVHIMYPDATNDQRMENYKLFKDFTDLVKQIVDEQEVQTENENIDKEWLAEKRKSVKAKQ